MPKYPEVLDERRTLDLVAAGRSVARFGDGEIKLLLNRDCVSQRRDPRLAGMLRRVLRDPGDCVVCIPRPDPRSPKVEFWRRFTRDYTCNLYNPKVVYGSSFITRPDSAPWIHTPDYWKKVKSIWSGKDVVLVAGSGKSLTPSLMKDARSVEAVLCPRQHAFDEYDSLLETLSKEERPVIMCCGATATVLAWSLCQRGVWALDLGHVGMFLKRVKLSPEDALQEGRNER